MDVEEIRKAWHRASEKDRPHDAIKALVELEKLEQDEPRWSQRLGEAYRRTGQTPLAVDAFARAFHAFFERGFLPRAIAMAKLVSSLDAERGDLLEKSLPKGASPPPLPVKKAPPPLPSTAKANAPPPLPPAAKGPPAIPAAEPKRGPPPLPLSVAAVESPPPRLVRPTVLSRAPDSTHDEVRFTDDPESSVQILLADFVGSDVITVEDEDEQPSTKRVDLPSAEVRARDKRSYDAYGAMASFRLFSTLSRDALVALAAATELIEFVPTAMIILRDERAFALYAIVSGSARVVVRGSPDISLVEGDVFGEGVLLDEGKRQADVRAESPLMTLRIEKAALDRVVETHPEVGNALFDLLARRLIMNLMHSSPLFASFEPSVRLELAQKFEVRRADAGTVIAERGRRSDGLYVLLSGSVMAESGGEHGRPPTRIARGTPFGHASLMGGPSDVTIRAEGEAVLLRMPAAGFAGLVAAYPPALAHLSETAGEPLPASRRD